MVNIRSSNDIILQLIDFFRVVQPLADTKPGSVFRDLLDAQSSQTALLYDELAKISNLQSLRLVSGNDLIKLAQNFGASKKAATKSSGVALLTFSSLPAVVNVSKGALMTASSGATFIVTNGVSVDPAQSNFYRSIATKFQNDLSFLNITDQFAVEVSVQSSTPGTSGNISKYALNRTTIPNVTNVTNTFPFTGGNDQETDAAFRNRVLAIFSGSNIGTALGFKNLALTNTSVEDALVIGPGDPLMTRDGTQVQQNPDGTFTILSEGSGGKIDIVILGTVLAEFTDTFIYRDQSNNNDPTDPSNEIVLGQIASDVGKTITRKRIDDIAAGTVPAQPVQEILEVTGSSSGTNFIPKSVDNLGRISGNFELIKDTGVFGGSPWGFDKFHWVSNKISLFSEDRVKSKFNGQDNTTFSDVLQIPQVKQNLSISNENSLVSQSDRSIIQLLHTPATNITRVFNTNTGERYVIINQNLDGSGSTNITGRIQISGNTLPASSDVLQVDYTWIIDYDSFTDYDGKILHNNIRPNTDSVDWGTSNAIKNERVLFTLNSTSTIFTGTTKLPITAVILANQFSSTNGFISAGTIPNFLNRVEIILTNIDNAITSIESIKLKNSNEEIFNTASNDGVIFNNRIVVGTQIKYQSIIVLPTDTVGFIGEYVNVVYNQSDTFNIVSSTGSFTSNNITIPVANISTTTSQIYLDVFYIASVQDVLSVGITNFPISRSGNGFLLNSNTGSVNSIRSNTIKNENQTIQVNSSNQFFVTLSIFATEYSLVASQIISVIDLQTNLELWNADFPGTVSVNSAGNYQLTFSGFNSPALGQNVLILYFADDIKRTQPFTYANSIISRDFYTLQFDFANNNFIIPIHSFNIESGLTFNIIDNTTGLSIGSGADGYISSILGSSATFSSPTFNFSNVDDVLGKSLRILHPSNINNDGVFNITALNTLTNVLTINININELLSDQISVIRIADGKELWSILDTIDTTDNLLKLPSTILAAQGDHIVVILFTNKVLHQSPTRLSITTTDQVTNTGIVSIIGTTMTKVSDIVFTAINNGLTQNVLEAIKTFLSLNSNSQISPNNGVVRIVKVEKVSTTTNNDVLKVLATYDVLGTKLNANYLYPNEMIFSGMLQNVEFTLPSTVNNLNNIPQIGDKLRITFYYATNNDIESVYFTKNGTLYTNKNFALIDKLYTSSGFNASKSTKFIFSYLTQPATGTRYKTFYDYLAPKQNERILIQFNYNRLIGDTTFTVENARPLNADVLIRAAKQLFVDATLNIVVKSDHIDSITIVLQNVKDKITNTINTNKLGDVINSSDLIAAAQAVDGVDRVRILFFNQTGKVGQVLTLINQSDQYFVANNIVVNSETR
jgi:uncharacterized phage protein gp47/JayE